MSKILILNTSYNITNLVYGKSLIIIDRLLSLKLPISGLRKH